MSGHIPARTDDGAVTPGVRCFFVPLEGFGPRLLGTRAEQPLATVHTMPNGWAALPEELLLMALERLRWAKRESAAVRLTSSRWRRIHDEGRKTLELRGARATDAAVAALCGRMPALTKLILHWCSLLTDQGLQAVAELKALTVLNLFGCSLVTDQGLQAVAELKFCQVHAGDARCGLAGCYNTLVRAAPSAVSAPPTAPDL